MKLDRITQLSEALTTPAYIFNTDEFENRAKTVRKCFTDKIGLCFSIKANPFLLKHFPDVFDKIEVCSPGELTICEKTGIDMNKVIFSGVNKTAPDVERAVCDNVGILTAESRLHLVLINNEALRQGKKVKLLLRLTAGSQFGMDESDVLSIIRERDLFKGVEIIGIHFFSGTQKKKSAVIEKELDYIDGFCDTLFEQTGFKTDYIEYGTGLAVEYFKADADELEMQRLREIAELLLKKADKYTITVEMGRFFAADCGYYLSKVIDVKTNKGINYAILDGGLNQLKYDGQLQGMQIPPIMHIHSADNKGIEEKWTLCGSLCTTADIISRDTPLESLSTGDVLVFCRTGAYSVSEGMANFLSRELPSVSLVSEKYGFETVREIINTDIFNTP